VPGEVTVRPITAKAQLWPDSEEFCDTRWEDLEATFAA
jgi:hypothetical protein